MICNPKFWLSRKKRKIDSRWSMSAKKCILCDVCLESFEVAIDANPEFAALGHRRQCRGYIIDQNVKETAKLLSASEVTVFRKDSDFDDNDHDDIDKFDEDIVDKIEAPASSKITPPHVYDEFSSSVLSSEYLDLSNDFTNHVCLRCYKFQQKIFDTYVNKEKYIKISLLHNKSGEKPKLDDTLALLQLRYQLNASNVQGNLIITMMNEILGNNNVHIPLPLSYRTPNDNFNRNLHKTIEFNPTNRYMFHDKHFTINK